MKKFSAFLCLFFSTISLVYGEIIETQKFQEITHYIDSETLVILDIDDTILIPVQTLGTDVWFISRLEFYLQLEQDDSLALNKALAEWEAVRHLTKVKIVEEGTDEIIRAMQENKIKVMGLTTQGLALATRTALQLQSLSVDLSKTAPSFEDHYFINGHNGVLYRKGILFTAGTSKGDALMKFLDAIEYRPKRIVFINDKKTHLRDVEKSVEIRGIPFIGLRYSYSDERVLDFKKSIADVQWTHSTFDHLLTDEEACSLLDVSF